MQLQAPRSKIVRAVSHTAAIIQAGIVAAIGLAMMTCVVVVLRPPDLSDRPRSAGVPQESAERWEERREQRQREGMARNAAHVQAIVATAQAQWSVQEVMDRPAALAVSENARLLVAVRCRGPRESVLLVYRADGDIFGSDDTEAQWDDGSTESLRLAKRYTDGGLVGVREIEPIIAKLQQYNSVRIQTGDVEDRISLAGSSQAIGELPCRASLVPDDPCGITADDIAGWSAERITATFQACADETGYTEDPVDHMAGMIACRTRLRDIARLLGLQGHGFRLASIDLDVMFPLRRDKGSNVTGYAGYALEVLDDDGSWLGVGYECVFDHRIGQIVDVQTDEIGI